MVSYVRVAVCDVLSTQELLFASLPKLQVCSFHIQSRLVSSYLVFSLDSCLVMYLVDPTLVSPKGLYVGMRGITIGDGQILVYHKIYKIPIDTSIIMFYTCFNHSSEEVDS